jgi:hypothetical protein
LRGAFLPAEFGHALKTICDHGLRKFFVVENLENPVRDELQGLARVMQGLMAGAQINDGKTTATRGSAVADV